MRNLATLVVPLSLAISACGSGTDAPDKTASPGTASFTPPPLKEGYIRFEAMKVTDIKPGEDLTICQYVMAPVDHDMDVLHIDGTQSKFGHHAVAFSYIPGADEQVGAELPCMMGSNEFSAGVPNGTAPAGGGTFGGTFLGAVSPAGGKVASLPEGVAFRLKKGEGVMLNVHYINTGNEPVDGESYLDLELVEPNATRPIAALFLNLNIGFKLPPNAETDSVADCVAKSDVNVIMMSNHMHEWGSHATTQVTRGDTGVVDVLRDDPTWNGDMVNNPTFATWTAEEPYVLHAGDTIRTSCSWRNTTADELSFPREMCISAGFALASGDAPKAPACFAGNWIDQGI
jgi:hypothetical protein